MLLHPLIILIIKKPGNGFSEYRCLVEREVHDKCYVNDVGCTIDARKLTCLAQGLVQIDELRIIIEIHSPRSDESLGVCVLSLSYRAERTSDTIP